MGEDVDRVKKERGREEEKECGREGRSKEGMRRERNAGERAGDTALQWILNMVLDMLIDKADTTTQTIIQCATCCRCSAISPVHCMLHEIWSGRCPATVTADIREMHDDVE